MSIENKLSSSILYNLNILKHVIPCSKQMEDVLVEGIFMKSNTNAFVYVTQYLFTIIDSKEFKKRFYWPIVDKRSENAYRTSSVDFINMLIDKHDLPYEHIKQVFVVHPSGKKFMGMILEILKIALKEVLQKKFKTNDYQKSIDIDAAVSTAKNMTQVESDLQQMMSEDVKTIRERSHEIQEILSKVMSNEELSDYEQFIKKWLQFLKERQKAIEDRNIKIDETIANAHKLFKDAQEMMSKKEFKLETVACDTLSNTSPSFLVESMKKTLPVIKNFIVSYPVTDVVVTEEEKRLVKQKLRDFEQMDALVKSLTEKCKNLHTKCSKIQAINEERQLLDNNDTFSADNDNWKLSAFTETSLNFEASKNCTTSVDLKAFNQLALLDENDNVLRAPSNFNRAFETSSAEKTFKIPPTQPAMIPSRRRNRRDPMELLNKATSSNQRGNQSFMENSMMMPQLKGPTSTPLAALSSTMLSPNMHMHGGNMLNFSTISEISVMSQPRPHIESPIDKTFEVKNANVVHSSQVRSPVVDITNAMPNINIIDATSESGNENTLVEKENFGSEFSTLIQRKSIADEDLFNVSDSCLKEDLPE